MKTSIFKFSDPKLIEISFDINETFNKDNFEGFNIKNSVDKEINDNSTEGIVSLKLTIGERNSSYPFYIEICNRAIFKCDDSNMFDKLIDTNAPALLLSYLRPIVSLLTSQAGFPSFNLPFINFTE